MAQPARYRLPAGAAASLAAGRNGWAAASHEPLGWTITVIPPGTTSNRSSSTSRRSSRRSSTRSALASSTFSCRARKLSDSVSTQDTEPRLPAAQALLDLNRLLERGAVHPRHRRDRYRAEGAVVDRVRAGLRVGGDV